MAAHKKNRINAGITIKSIPPGVSKVRYYLALLKRHLIYYSSFDPINFWRGIIAGLLKAPLGAAIIYVTGLLVDSIVDYYQHPSLGIVNVAGISIPTPFLYLGLLFIFNRLLRGLISLVEISDIRTRNSVTAGYREDVAERFHKLNSQEVDREQVRNALTKIETYWLNNAKSLYIRITNIGEFLVSIIISFVAVLTLSPWLAFLVIIAPAFEIFMLLRHYHRHGNFVDDISPLLLEKSYYFSTLTDARTFPERKINGVFRYLLNHYTHISEIVANGYKRVLVQGEKEIARAKFVDAIIMLAFKGYFLVTSLYHRVAVGRITAGMGYMDALYTNSHDLLHNLVSMYDELTFIEYLYDFFDTKGFADQRLKGKHLKEGAPVIAFENVSFSYPDAGRSVLEDASMIIKPGDRVMILGKDGSGKSSLLAIMAGLYQLTGGEVTFDGIPHKSLARGQVKSKMSVVPEDFARYYMTMRENIVMGDPRKSFDEELYKKALEITGLDEWMRESNISDTDTVLGNFFKGGISISSGHWQRLAIARAIYRNRDIFLLDQPFTYIDSQSAEQILPQLIKFIGKRTVIFISEHTWHEKYFNKVFELKEKKLVEKK